MTEGGGPAAEGGLPLSLPSSVLRRGAAPSITPGGFINQDTRRRLACARPPRRPLGAPARGEVFDSSGVKTPLLSGSGWCAVATHSLLRAR